MPILAIVAGIILIVFFVYGALALNLVCILGVIAGAALVVWGYHRLWGWGYPRYGRRTY